MIGLPPAVSDLCSEARTLTDPAAAAAKYQQALELNPTSLEALLGAADSLRRARRLADARRVVERGRLYYPDDSRFELERGLIEVLDGHPSAGLEILDRLAKAGENVPRIWIGRIRALRLTGQLVAASEACVHARAQHPANRRVLEEIVDLRMQTGEYATAVELLFEIGGQRAVIDAVQRCSVNAKGLLPAVRQRFDADVAVLRAVAEACLSMQDDEDAASVLQQIRRLVPRDGAVLIRLLRALDGLDKLQLAEWTISEAIEAGCDMELPALRIEIAYHSWRGGNPDGAVSGLQRPDQVLDLLARREIKGERLRLLEVALTRWRDHPRLLRALADGQAATGRLHQALATYQRLVATARTADARFAYVTFLRERSLRDGGASRAETKQAAEQANADYPDEPRFRRLLGHIALDTDDFGSAVQYLLGAHDLIPAAKKEPDVPDRKSLLLRQTGGLAVGSSDSTEVTDAIYGRLRVGDVSRAQGLADAALSLQRDSALLLAYGAVLQIRRRWAEAAAVLEECAAGSKGKPEYVPSIIGAIALRTFMRHFESAETQLNLAAASLGATQEPLLLERSGWLEFGQNRFSNALTRFQSLVRRYPARGAGFEGVAAVHLVQQHPEAALETYQLAVDKKVAPGRMLTLKAEVLMHLGRLEDALACANEATAAKEEDDSDCHTTRARILSRLNRHEEAQSGLESLLSSDVPRPGRDMLFAALTELRSWRPANGAEPVVAGADHEPTDVVECYVAGTRCFATHDYVKAAKYFRLWCEKEPFVAYSHATLAEALVKQVPDATSPLDERHEASVVTSQERRLKEEALHHAEKALEIDPTLALAHRVKGLVAVRDSQLTLAEYHFRSAIRASAIDEAHRDLGNLYVKMGRLADAERALTSACENRRDALARVALADLHASRRQSDQAHSALLYAFAIAPDDAVVIRAFALFLRRNGRSDEAIQLVNRTLSTVADHERARLHLLLCQLITEKADENQNNKLYRRALDEAKAARSPMKETPPSAFQATVSYWTGVVSYRLKKRKFRVMAGRCFVECLDADPDHFMARYYIERLAEDRHRRLRNYVAGLAGGVFAVGCAATSWWLVWNFWRGDRRIDNSMVAGWVPILLGAAGVAILVVYRLFTRADAAWKVRLPGLAGFDDIISADGHWLDRSHRSLEYGSASMPSASVKEVTE
jgi:tetratricopeptide (TPR) repeat protein